jgi:glycosyltransferase involved in cell wall biosynthesis
MKFLIVTHAPHKENNGDVFSYGPYVREMNIWTAMVDEVKVLAPGIPYSNDPIDEKLIHGKAFSFLPVPSFDTLTWRGKLKSLFVVPYIFYSCAKAMAWADHIHIRSPGNMGLIGLMVQIFFPFKKKTVKYAGNWEDYAGEHRSYKLQKYLARNTFLTRNTSVLIYGQWKNFTQNCLSFFTASYTENDFKVAPKKKSMADPILKFVFAGTLDERKRPDISIEVMKLLRASGISNIELNILGTGAFLERCEKLISEYGLNDTVFLRGNVSAQNIKHYYNDAHFLVFLSRMEGWPKVVAESMSWGCVPITTAISCVPWMLGDQTRGRIVTQDAESVAEEVKKIVRGEIDFDSLSSNAIHWSRQYTLEKFGTEISKLI